MSNWYALIVVMGGVFLSTMDSGMVNIAIPTIMRFFTEPLEGAARVVTVYLLTITVTLVFWGRVGDRFGLERVYLTGVCIFSLGALFCFISQEYLYLLFSRCIQGLGAAMMMASGPAIIKRSFPHGLLGRNLGLVGIATACGLLTGPFVSGQLLMHFSWRSIFLTSSLLSLTIGAMGFFLFKGKLSDPSRGVVYSFDWMGGLCWVAIVLLSTDILQSLNAFSVVAIVYKSILLVGLLVVFILIERVVQYPILPLKSFAKRYYWVGVVTAFLSFSSLFSVLVLLPFYLEFIQLLSSKQIGLCMMSVPATLILLSPAAGYLFDKIGARFLTSFGLFVSFSALIGLSNLRGDSSILAILPLLAAVGAGQSIFLSPNSASVLLKTCEESLGATAGILATARNFGMVFGATASTVLFSYFSNEQMGISGAIAMGMLSDEHVVEALGLTFKCLAGLSFTAVLISLQRD